MCDELVPYPHICDKLVQDCYLIVTDVSGKTLKNWNRVQNAADWGLYYQSEEYACVNRLFAYCKAGNFNIHIWVWFGYSIC